MMKLGEEVGNILRKCVIRLAREKGANPEMGGIQKGQGPSQQKEQFPVICREIK